MHGLTTMTRVNVHLKGVHRAAKRLADGRLVQYHYAWRGGPRFWVSTSGIRVGSMAYIDAYREVCAAHAARHCTKGTFQEVIDAFVASGTFADLGERTRHDHLKNIANPQGIEQKFGTYPIATFNDPRIRHRVNKWRDGFSKGTGDNMIATLQRIVSYGHEEGLIGYHHLLRIKRRTTSNRADIIWLPDEVDTFVAGAPEYIGRILIVAVETGFRPGDLCVLDRSHFEPIPGSNGRILLRTKKSGQRKFAAVPVSERLARLLAELPPEQSRIIVWQQGKPYKTARKLGQLVSRWRDELGLRKNLRLYDARGTAVTRLVRAGCSLAELAGHMGWSLQHASQMLERYAALDPEMTDQILRKVQAEEARRIARIEAQKK